MSRSLQDVEPQLLACIPDHGALALDIGANDGCWSHELAKHFDEVHAFEPQPIIEDVPDNVSVFHVAVGQRFGDAKLRLYHNSEHATMVERSDIGYGPQVGTLEIPQVALDDLYLDRQVDFIKIDVEGAEADVMRGARRLLSEQHPTLVIELHSREAREEIFDLLDGYVIDAVLNPLSDVYYWLHVHA